MDIRMSSESQQLAKRFQFDRQLGMVLKAFAAQPRWPWRECWTEIKIGLVLFHFCNWADLRGEYRRVPVGVDHIKSLTERDVPVLVTKILQRAAGHRPERPLALLPLGLAEAKLPIDRIHYDHTADPSADGVEDQ